MANTTGEKELKTNWPIVSGIEVNERHDGREMNLVAEEGSLVAERKKAGL